MKMAMRILEGPAQARLVTALARRGATDLADVEPAVRRIVNDVRRNGDRAVRRYATRWDGLGERRTAACSEDELHQAWEQTDSELQQAIEHAAGNIRRYAEWQAPAEQNGGAKSSRASASASWCVRWNRWDATFRAAAILCLRRCS
jgi:histidinol dehydrogenase